MASIKCVLLRAVECHTDEQLGRIANELSERGKFRYVSPRHNKIVPVMVRKGEYTIGIIVRQEAK